MFEQLKTIVTEVFESPDCPPDSQPISQIKYVREQLKLGLFDAKRLVEARNERRLDEFLEYYANK